MCRDFEAGVFEELAELGGNVDADAGGETGFFEKFDVGGEAGFGVRVVVAVGSAEMGFLELEHPAGGEMAGDFLVL